MKKVILILVFVVSFLSVSTNVLADSNSTIVFQSEIEKFGDSLERQDILNLHVSSTSRGNGLFGSYSDKESNEYGPNDVYIYNGKFYVLDTAKKSIVVIHDSNVEKIYDLSNLNIVPYMLSIENDRVYVLDITNKKLVIIGDDSKNKVLDVDLEDNLAVPSFSVLNDNIYVSYVDAEEYTKVYSLDRNTNSYEFVEKLSGRYINGFLYEFIRDNEPYENHSGRLTVTDINSGEIQTIVIKSKNLLLGASFLGCDKDSNLVIKTKEYNTNINPNAIHYIKRVDRLGNTLNEEVDTREMYLLRNMAFDNEKLYTFNRDDRNFAIEQKQLDSNPLEQSYEEFNILNPNEKQVSMSNSALVPRYPGITRAEIMRNAKSFHVSFWWNCRSINIAPMNGYIKPRYLNQGAGRYQTMPYCWGGFSSISQFTTGLSNDGRAGNINTSAPGHVYNTYGLDCSGYVSRCWGYKYKLSTSTIVNVSTAIQYHQLREGDALNIPRNHVMLFEKFDSNGDYILYESTLLNQYDRVSHTIRSKSSVEGAYAAIRYQEL